MQTQLAGLEGKDVDSLRKATTATRDSIKIIREFISGKTSDKQGITRFQGITVMATMQTAQQYITGKSLAPAAQEEALVKNAEDMITQAVQKVNSFYNTRWKAYRQLVEATKIGLFKDYTPID
jgi:hypothetical protein